MAAEGPGPRHGDLGLGEAEGWLGGQRVSRGSLSPAPAWVSEPSFTAATGRAQGRKWPFPFLLKGLARPLKEVAPGLSGEV